MDTILQKLETIIDDIERDSQLTRDEILLTLTVLKVEIEDYQLRKDDGPTDLQWEDLF